MKATSICLFLFLTLTTMSADIASAIKAEKAKRPPGQLSIQWRKDLMKAFTEATVSNRPLFITFRCLSCKQCQDFDKSVLDGGPELGAHLKEFITVRLTDASLLNSKVFPFKGYQDLDLSWWGYFMSPKGEIYSVFGGRDHISDKTRISVKALRNTMERVLNHHYHPDREKWSVDGAAANLDAKAIGPKELPGYEPFKKSNVYFQKQSCIHCHQVSDILKFPEIQKGNFKPKKDFDIWPLPENLGLVLDRDHGLKVTKVFTSKYASHKLKPGDLDR